ncbi:MAG: hypothetical protein M1812_008510 [Candelaria pacifica]|nr:MAG: hypothetical protein M1812_008510 [Candelaria pacifica]
MVRMSNSVYAASAKFDGSAVDLSNDQIRKIAPSIFATQAHESRSDRFQPIPTIDILEGLRKEGFAVVGVQQGNTRDESRRDFTKHMIRLRQIKDAQKYSVGDTVYEVILRNANDGTASYNLLAGLFRIRCLNSLVAHTDTLDTVKVFHKGADIADKVIDGTFTVLENAEKALAAPDQWSKIQMTKEAQLVLAESVHQVRFTNQEGEITTPIRPAQLLKPLREGDRGTDLWTTVNVLQEHAIRGGDSAFGRGTNGRTRRFSTKAVNGIEQNITLNKAIFALGDKMAQILKAA